MSANRLDFALEVCAALATILILAFAPPGWAQEKDNSRDEFETKHIFGFTEGTDVGDAGDKEMEFTTTGSIGKRGGGGYNAIEQQAVYEAAPSERFGYEIGPLGVSQQIANVPGLSNLSQTSFSGFFVEPKYIFLKRGIDAPFGFAVSVAPEWSRIETVTGDHVSNFELDTKLYFDSELIEKKLYAAINLVYAPEMGRETGVGFSQYALAGATAALTWRITPSLAIGAETEFYQVYNSLGFTGRTGSAAYVGPTLWAQITPKAFVSLAWSAQVAGNPANASPSTLCPLQPVRHRARAGPSGRRRRVLAGYFHKARGALAGRQSLWFASLAKTVRRRRLFQVFEKIPRRFQPRRAVSGEAFAEFKAFAAHAEQESGRRGFSGHLAIDRQHRVRRKRVGGVGQAVLREDFTKAERRGRVLAGVDEQGEVGPLQV